MIGSRNSQAASDYAAKKRVALERANKMREERKNNEYKSTRVEASSRPSSGAMVQSSSRAGTQVSKQLEYPVGIPGADVRIESYGDHTERIRVRPTPIGSSSSSSGTMKATSREQLVSSRNAQSQKKAAPLNRAVPFDKYAASSSSSSAEYDYTQPPQDPAGRLMDISGRPLMCCSFDEGRAEVVFGGSDHALYSISLLEPKKRHVQMHSKAFGHSDWVTAVTHLSNGKVVSCAMDGYICLWSQDKRRCQKFHGHNRSLTKVACLPGTDIVASASYDKTIGLWALGGSERETGKITAPYSVLQGCKAPVLEIAVTPRCVAGGGKDGGLLSWDVESGSCLMKVRGHEAGVTCLSFGQGEKSEELLSGGQDGAIKLWDARSKRMLCSAMTHAGAAKGETPVATLVRLGEHYIASGGADGRVVLHDVRRGLAQVTAYSHCRNGIYSMEAAGDCLFVGDGAGMLYCYNPERGTGFDAGGADDHKALCYGLGASEEGAVRALVVAPQLGQVVAGGEDGNALVFQYAQGRVVEECRY